MKFTLEIDCDNAAFGWLQHQMMAEVARILRDTATRIEAVGSPVNYPLRDAYGNPCGQFRFEQTD